MLEHADACAASGQHELAINFYTQLLSVYCENAVLHLRRAEAYSELYEFSRAAEDARQAIMLAPDNAAHYWLLGGYLLSEEFLNSGTIIASDNTSRFDEIIWAYTIALEKDPVSQAAWLNLIEIKLLMERYDEAIGSYGACAPYITNPKFTLIRSFLGCLAITLNGEEIEEDDEKQLHDDSIRVSSSSYRVGEVAALINGLDQFAIEGDIKNRARDIYKAFLSHYDCVPKDRYHSREE